MRVLLAFLLTVACSIPTFEYIDGDDVRGVIAESGFRIQYTKYLPATGLTDCVDKIVWINTTIVTPGSVGETAILVHEAIHVLQAAELGCGKFLLQYAVDPTAIETPAYENEYIALGCVAEPTVAAALTYDIHLTPDLCE